MSGIYIKGMKMPKNCYRCPLNYGEWRPEQDPHIYCQYTKKAIPYSDVPTDRRLDCCGLEDVPPLGDLVKDLRMDYAYAAAMIVALRPVIIPADRLKEETPAKDTNVPTYDLLYEEGGPDTR